jgi:hypothetical protein
MRLLGQRVGVVRLTEVMRQRDPAERRALAALHDGIPQRWIGWASEHDRVALLADDRDAPEHAVGEWAAGVETHGVEQVVLIARENETRRALNELARAHQRLTGRLGEEHAYGPVTLAVGDRVICRRNDRDLDVDNGMRGTVRDVDSGGVVIETDAHLVRDLPAGYVAEHVEHAYALTGHGMQGGTVEQAIVLAAPHDLSQGWSYTALSRARGQTRLLITGRDPAQGEREDIAPAGRRPPTEESVVLALVGRRMLDRDDEDLAIAQLPAPGHTDDPELRRIAPDEPLQERAATQAEPQLAVSASRPLAGLRERVEQLQAQLAALPSEELYELDELDRRAIELTELRDRLRDSLGRLPEPKTRLLGRVNDQHLLDRTRLASQLDGVEANLERTISERAPLARQLGNPDAVRDERDGLRSALTDARRELDQTLAGLVERELADRPAWTREALGERPAGLVDGERWDRAAEQLARYRITYEIIDGREPLGPEPPAGDQRHDYQRVQQISEDLAQRLGRGAPDHDLGLG